LQGEMLPEVGERSCALRTFRKHPRSRPFSSKIHFMEHDAVRSPLSIVLATAQLPSTASPPSGTRAAKPPTPFHGLSKWEPAFRSA
jgi:hypothetical protein